jgi:hypothetical protein
MIRLFEDPLPQPEPPGDPGPTGSSKPRTEGRVVFA